jgi:hypothetical protein
MLTKQAKTFADALNRPKKRHVKRYRAVARHGIGTFR